MIPLWSFSRVLAILAFSFSVFEHMSAVKRTGAAGVAVFHVPLLQQRLGKRSLAKFHLARYAVILNLHTKVFFSRADVMDLELFSKVLSKLVNYRLRSCHQKIIDVATPLIVSILLHKEARVNFAWFEA